MKIFRLFMTLFFFVFFSCTTVAYRDPSIVEGSTEWGPKEIKDTVATMVDSLSKFFVESKERPNIELNKVLNRSSEHIDTTMVSNELTTNLIKKKIVFIDRRERLDALKEAELGMKGLIKEGTEIKVGEFVSPNFKLSGEITDNVRYVDGQKVQYIVVTLRLIKLSTGGIDWQEQKSFLKVTDRAKYGW